jgi:hypothetical protein
MNFDLTENWGQSNDFQAMVGFSAGTVAKLGKQVVQFNVGPKFPLNNHTPGDWTMKAALVLVFPK